MDSEKVLGRYIRDAEEECFKALRAARGRGYASDSEAWAEMKAVLDRTIEKQKTAKKLHDALWTSIIDMNDDEFYVTLQELERSALALAGEFVNIAAQCSIAQDGE